MWPRQPNQAPLHVALSAHLSALQVNSVEAHKQVLSLAAEHVEKEALSRAAAEEEIRRLRREVKRLRRELTEIPDGFGPVAEERASIDDLEAGEEVHVRDRKLIPQAVQASMGPGAGIGGESLPLPTAGPQELAGACPTLQLQAATRHLARPASGEDVSTACPSEDLDEQPPPTPPPKPLLPHLLGAEVLSESSDTMGPSAVKPQGAGRRRADSEISGSDSALTKAKKLLKGKAFGLICSLVVVLNAVYIGALTSSEVSREFGRLRGESMPEVHVYALDVFFSLFFLIEVVLRMTVDGKRFFVGRGRYWNLFDACVVAVAIYELCLALRGVTAVNGVSILRLFRILRVIRLLRVAKVFTPLRPVIRTLQTILLSLSGSASCFVSALVMLFFFLFIFAVLFMQGVKGFLASASFEESLTAEFQEAAGLMQNHFGSMELTMWTLIGCVSGGYDWAEVAKPIVAIGRFYKLAFLLYVLFVLFALLNILTGIFVNVAIDSCKMNREIAIDAAITNKESIIKEMVDLFHEADRDCSGTLSWEEFEDYIQDERIKAFFMALELDMTSAHRIFDLIDTSGDGQLDLHEFVQGCIDLRGGAKKVDISILGKERVEILERVSRMEEHFKYQCQQFGTQGAA